MSFIDTYVCVIHYKFIALILVFYSSLCCSLQLEILLYSCVVYSRV